MKFDVLILAAGQSTRMGSDKALLPVNDSPAICYLIHKLTPYARSFTIILSLNYDTVSQVLAVQFPGHNFTILNNENHRFGMFSSVLKGLNAISGNYPVLMHQIDQPFVEKEIYRQLSENYKADCFTLQPSLVTPERKFAGHPLIINPPFREIILNYNLTDNLKQIILKHQDKRGFVEVKDESILHNLNTPEQFRKIKKEKEYGK